jgi:hypothetical protein
LRSPSASSETLITSWVPWSDFASRSTPGTTRSGNVPFVGMFTTLGRQRLHADSMIVTRSRRRNGSPPENVNHMAERPSERKTLSHSSAFSSTTGRSYTLHVRQRELHRNVVEIVRLTGFIRGNPNACISR